MTDNLVILDHKSDCPIFNKQYVVRSIISAIYDKTDPLSARSKIGSAASRLLGLWVRIPPGGWMSVCYECCAFSGRDLSVELITRPECGVSECDREDSIKRRPWPARGCRAIKKYMTKDYIFWSHKLCSWHTLIFCCSGFFLAFLHLLCVSHKLNLLMLSSRLS